MGWKPLRWIGVRSYGIYLWMFPIIVLTTPTVTSGVDPLRAALQVAASIGVAALSWKFIEEPIRHGALGRLLAADTGGHPGSRRRSRRTRAWQSASAWQPSSSRALGWPGRRLRPTLGS